MPTCTPLQITQAARYPLMADDGRPPNGRESAGQGPRGAALRGPARAPRPEHLESAFTALARHLCLSTAGLGGCYWLLLPEGFPTSLVWILASGWIVARSLGVVVRPTVGAVLAAMGLLAVLAVSTDWLPPGIPQRDVFPAFSPAAYSGMLAYMLAADARRYFVNHSRSSAVRQEQAGGCA